uniref:Uncharacterized protein n=1 Tax=Strongyloides venezuelensis TaxID=75913 RepID=A0A0K0FRW2_STRVS
MREGQILAPEKIIFLDKDIPDFKYYHTPQTTKIKFLIDRLKKNSTIKRSNTIKTCSYYMLSERDSSGKLALNSDGTSCRRFILDGRRQALFQRFIEQLIPNIENAQIFTNINDLLILTNPTFEHHYESTL